MINISVGCSIYNFVHLMVNDLCSKESNTSKDCLKQIVC